MVPLDLKELRTSVLLLMGVLTRRSFLLSEKPDTLAADIAAIDRTLQLLGCTVNPDDYMPTRRNQRIFRKGEMLRLIRDVLKDADRPMTSREICLSLIHISEPTRPY